MDKCILHVTDHEYDQILQLNHDAVVWTNEDTELLSRLEHVIGEDVVGQVRRYDECRMQKHDRLDGIPRIEEDEATPEPSFPG